MGYPEPMAGTDTPQTSNFGPAPTVVLVNPQLGENIGMAARAMANFGLFDLRLVDPREGWDPERAEAAASGAHETVKNALVFKDLPSCLREMHYVYATTARPRDMTKEVMTPEQAGFDMRARIGRGEKVAILFGRERFGLNNDEVSLADVVITAPVNPAYASLNIAQAVLLVTYEWFKHEATSLGQGTPELAALSGPGLHMSDTRPATKDELYGFYGHLEQELDLSGFFKTDKLKPSMLRNLRNVFARASLSEQEVRSLRGVISSLTRKHLRPKQEKSDG
jgi:tRNA/rRNA methyltransferase